MNTMSAMPTGARRTAALTALGIAFALALGLSPGAIATTSADALPSTSTAMDAGAVTASLEQCVTSVVQAERSVTFTGEMSSIPGAARMTMRIDVEERLPGEGEFHPVAYPGLGVWRAADPKVKVYKYLKQVTNLSSPASYRGDVRFHWISAKGHVIKRAERMTARCQQPASPSESTPVVPPTTMTVTPGA